MKGIAGDRGAEELLLTSIESDIAALLELTETGGIIATDGTEQNVYINNAPVALYKPERIFIDFTAHTAGETVVVRTYYRITALGGLIKNTEATYAGAQDPLLIDIPLKENRHGMSVTIEKTGGNNRDYPFEVMYSL